MTKRPTGDDWDDDYPRSFAVGTLYDLNTRPTKAKPPKRKPQIGFHIPRASKPRRP